MPGDPWDPISQGDMDDEEPTAEREAAERALGGEEADLEAAARERLEENEAGQGPPGGQPL